MNLLNAGCGTHYAKGWVNCDVWEEGDTRPDVRVTPGEPYPFPDDHFDAVYLGHVIEHVAWPDVPGFLLDMNRVAKPGAPILIVGPDVMRTIELWHQGRQPWTMVLATIEHQDSNYQPGREDEVWLGAAHHWNCHHDRVVTLLRDVGFPDPVDMFDQIPNNPLGKSWDDPVDKLRWPVVGKHEWQFAVKTYAF